MSSKNLEPQTNPSLAELKELFAAHLREPGKLKRPEGIATGLESLDKFLFWGGIPKGALSLFTGSLGTGATSLWIDAAARSIEGGRWAAWIDHDVRLSPLSLCHRGMDLGRVLSVERPESEKKLFWLLQELMASSLFELIGCDLGSSRLKEHQLRKLQAQARESQVALVFLTQNARGLNKGSVASVFSLIVAFEKRRLLVERALHRPTPHDFARSVSYARFTIHTADRIGSGANVSAPELAHKLTSRALSQAVAG